MVALSFFFNLAATPWLPAAPQPCSLAYVLQAEKLAASRQEAIGRLANCERDWIVIDRLFDSSENGEYTAAEINLVRNARHDRRVFAYISIGEAENYRPYWKREWDADRNGCPDRKAPPWLCAENPDWKGNYRVRYWHQAWQKIVLAQVDKTIQAGFDGIYLDLVDAFETFEFDPVKKDWIDHRLNTETEKSYRQDMIQWVCCIATYARKQKTSFLVVPQNGAQLLEDADYLATIDAIGIEDLFTNGNHPQKREHTHLSIGFLDKLKTTAKPILVIEYGTNPAMVRNSTQGVEKNGYILLLTDRKLKTLGRSGNLGQKDKRNTEPTRTRNGVAPQR